MTTTSPSPRQPTPLSPPASAQVKSPRPAAFLVALTLAIGVLLWRCLFGLQTIYYGDTSLYELHMHLWNARAFASGGLPQWASYVHLGLPHLANPTAAALYPPTWIEAIAPVVWSINLRFALHLWLAGAFTWLAARRLGADGPGAALAGFCYALGGPLLSYHASPVFMAAAAWVPLGLWAWLGVLDAARTGGRWLRPAIWTGFAATAALLAGDPQAVFVLGLWLGLWTVVAVSAAADRRAVSRVVIAAATTSLALFVTLGAAQWLPTWHLLVSSVRGEAGQAVDTLTWATHPLRLLTIGLPGLFGSSLPELSLWGFPFADEGRYWFFSLYAGTVAVLAISFGWRERGWRTAGVAWLVFTAMALGHHLGLLDLLSRLPGFGLFRYPEKYALPASLAFALMAGVALGPAVRQLRGLRRAGLSLAGFAVALGLAAPLFVPLMQSWSPVPNSDLAVAAMQHGAWVVVAVAAIVVGISHLGLRGSMAAPRVAAALVLVAAIDLVVVHAPMVVTADPALLEDVGPVARQLRDHGAEATAVGPFRVARDSRFDETRLHRDAQGLVGDTVRRRLSVDTAVAAAAGIDLVAGYTAALLDYRRSLGRTLFAEIGTWARLLNIRYVIVPAGAPASHIDAAIASGELETWHDAADLGVRVLALRRPGGRVFCEPAVDGGEDAARCDLISWSPERVEVAVRSEAPQRVVHSASFVAGWRAQIDGGEPIDVHLAHRYLQAIDVPGGEHAVVFVYEAPGLRPGLALSGLGLLLLALLWWRSRPRLLARVTEGAFLDEDHRPNSSGTSA